MRVYIAGKITGDKNYKEKFARAEEQLASQGHSVMNPAILKVYPEFTNGHYMRVSRAMLRVCDAIYLLPDWKESKGATDEYQYAKQHGLKVMFDGQ